MNAPVLRKKQQPTISVVDSQNLDRLARQIRESYQTTESIAESVHARSKEALAEAIICGQLLNKAKVIVGYGNWAKWLANHCAHVAPRRAQQFMEIAKANPERLEEAASVQGALRLIGKVYADPNTHVRAHLTNGDAPQPTPETVIEAGAHDWKGKR